MGTRASLKDKKRIVIKIGSSSLTHPVTRDLNYHKLESLVRVLCDLKNMGKEIVLVSSGAQAVGRKEVGYHVIPEEMPKKQALAAIGQAKLMMTYQRLFSQYSQMTAQILLTKHTLKNERSSRNALNTFQELMKMGVIAVVNENDTVATDEIEFGDNDHLSAFVSSMIHADLLILLSDIDGLYSDDPFIKPDAERISLISDINQEYIEMAKDTSQSGLGSGGMKAKVDAARIATNAGADVVIACGDDVNVLYDIINGADIGTFFAAHKDENYNIHDYF